MVSAEGTSITIKYDINNPIVSPLKPGQLGYSYPSGTLFIGPANLDQGGLNVIELVKFQNNILNFIIQEVRIDIFDKIPSSNAIFQALQKKASLQDSNLFKSANYFPNVDVKNTPASQEQLVVNVKSLKDYINYRFDSFSPDNGKSHMAFTQRYEFLLPSDTWDITHNYNTDNINIVIRELGSNRQLMAPYDTLDDSHIRIYFSKPTAGYVDIEFF